MPIALMADVCDTFGDGVFGPGPTWFVDQGSWSEHDGILEGTGVGDGGQTLYPVGWDVDGFTLRDSKYTIQHASVPTGDPSDFTLVDLFPLSGATPLDGDHVTAVLMEVWEDGGDWVLFIDITSDLDAVSATPVYDHATMNTWRARDTGTGTLVETAPGPCGPWTTRLEWADHRPHATFPMYPYIESSVGHEIDRIGVCGLNCGRARTWVAMCG